MCHLISAVGSGAGLGTFRVSHQGGVRGCVGCASCLLGFGAVCWGCARRPPLREGLATSSPPFLRQRPVRRACFGCRQAVCVLLPKPRVWHVVSSGVHAGGVASNLNAAAYGVCLLSWWRAAWGARRPGSHPSASPSPAVYGDWDFLRASVIALSVLEARGCSRHLSALCLCTSGRPSIVKVSVVRRQHLVQRSCWTV